MADEIPYLKEQFQNARPILFTGAGFSCEAFNVSGSSIPSVKQLKEALWNLCFPGTAFDANSSLGDLFHEAVSRHKNDLRRLVTGLLTVDGTSIPSWYRTYFELPWNKYYTLNIDDLALAIVRQFETPWRVAVISAINANHSQEEGGRGALFLDAVHLNGFLRDDPELITFSAPQYGQRSVRPDVHYFSLTGELQSKPFVFVGTELNEPSLWAYVELRRQKGGRGLRDLRPKSFLVTPSLSMPRKALLADYNIEWLSMTAEEFAKRILADVLSEAGVGFEKIRRQRLIQATSDRQIPLVADIAITPDKKTGYLLGEEPAWADIQSGRAVSREIDDDVWSEISKWTQNKRHSLVVVSGTAGSGKGTTFMRACLRLSAAGHVVGWVDRNSSFSPREISRLVQQDRSPSVLAIDDADAYGQELAPLMRELSRLKKPLLILLGIRSSKMDQVLNPIVLGGANRIEKIMPPLADKDIDGLIKVLDRDNRLGDLKKLSYAEQHDRFSKQAGRQLLVAMIQATSGRKFEEKIFDEWKTLQSEDQQRLYAIVSLATIFRSGLARDEVLLAAGEISNAVQNQLIELVRRGILVEHQDTGLIRARHRAIADVLVEELQKRSQLTSIIQGLLFAMATKWRPHIKKGDRCFRLLRSLLNHDFLSRVLDLQDARTLYDHVENLLSEEPHYWLQRGSLEVEQGDLRLAENFLGQAKALDANDGYIMNEWGYLLMKQAIENPSSPHALDLFTEGYDLLDQLIKHQQGRDCHPYHVIAAQGLSWARRGISDGDHKKEFLEQVLTLSEEGMQKHPYSKELTSISQALKRELLSLAVHR